MGLFDGLGAGVPGGNLSKPILIALGALLASKALGGGGLGSIFGGTPGSTAVPPAPPGGNGGFFGNAGPPPTQPAGTAPPSDGGLLGGLGGLVQQFEQNGLGGLVGSWVGKGPNQEISPGQLHQGLGSDIVDQLAQKTGMSRDQLLAELSKVLPGVVDHLTPDGRLPAST